MNLKRKYFLSKTCFIEKTTLKVLKCKVISNKYLDSNDYKIEIFKHMFEQLYENTQNIL